MKEWKELAKQIENQQKQINQVTQENRFLKIIMIPMGIFALMSIGMVSWGDNITVPYTFSGGTLISASQFNSNFSTIYDHVDKLSEVAILKDVKSSGGEGTSVAGSWQTRTLHTVEGVSSFVSLSSNQFTLPAGRYFIEASAPASDVADHIIKLVNVTDSNSTAILGTASYVPAQSVTRSTLSGYLHLSSSKTFELQHYTSNANATYGLGGGIVGGEEAVYSIVTIVRLPST